MRVVEKHIRDEVANRCVEFLDIAINFILYIEQIYSIGLLKYLKTILSNKFFFI